MNKNVIPPINPILLNPQWIQFQKSINQTPQPLMSQNNQIQSHAQSLMLINSHVQHNPINPTQCDIDFTSKISRYDQEKTIQLVEDFFNQSVKELISKKEINEISSSSLNIEIQTIDFNHGLSANTTTTIKMGNLDSNCNNKKINVEPEKQRNDSNIQESKSLQDLQSNRQKLTPIKIEHLILKPHRESRPHKIVIILRGPPGSGKSFVANLIKQEEEKHVSSSDKPKYLSIDNYFITEQDNLNKNQVLMKYEYDESMDEAYQRSLIKSFKKIIDDDLFNFIIVDMINEKIADINEMSSHASTKGFKIYVADLNFVDELTCFNRNVHNRTQGHIKKIKERWESLPNSYLSIDVGFFFNNHQEIQQVEMEDETVKIGGTSTEKNENRSGDFDLKSFKKLKS